MEYSRELVEQVWEKARAGSDVDASTWREDECGAWISRPQYGQPETEFGWKIENISPGGPPTLENLRPLHYRNAFNPGTGFHHCLVTADRTGLSSTSRTLQPRNRGV